VFSFRLFVHLFFVPFSSKLIAPHCHSFSLHLNIRTGTRMAVGVASGFIDSKLISFILQKAVVFMIFAWPIMYKGRGVGDNSDEVDDEGVKE